MPALADKFGWLVGPFHVLKLQGSNFYGPHRARSGLSGSGGIGTRQPSVNLLRLGPPIAASRSPSPPGNP
jgi:hypothetical protein